MTSYIVKLAGKGGIFTVLALLLCTSAHAQGDTELLKTNWIEMVRGFQDAESGVQVRDVTTDSKTGAMQLQIAVPKVRMGDGVEMEEVRVIGQRPQEFEIEKWLPQFKYEWIEDYDNDYYGLLVRFTEEQKTPLRLYFSSESGFLQP